jgi:hypothetical protein
VPKAFRVLLDFKVLKEHREQLVHKELQAQLVTQE